MKKRNLGIICACLALCGMAVAGTYAWLTAEAAPITNYFTSTDSNKISIELKEKNFEQDLANKYVPGDTFGKDPTIKNTSNSQSVYGAIKVTYQKGADDQGHKVTKDEFLAFATINGFSTEWKMIATDNAGTELYMYTKEITHGTIVTPELFQSVTINKTVVANANGKLPSYNILIEGYATQFDEASPAEAEASLIALAGMNTSK